jgi:hypothetical protein
MGSGVTGIKADDWWAKNAASGCAGEPPSWTGEDAVFGVVAVVAIWRVAGINKQHWAFPRVANKSRVIGSHHGTNLGTFSSCCM